MLSALLAGVTLHVIAENWIKSVKSKSLETKRFLAEDVPGFEAAD